LQLSQLSYPLPPLPPPPPVIQNDLDNDLNVRLQHLRQ
jgi:hypothetical protein